MATVKFWGRKSILDVIQAANIVINSSLVIPSAESAKGEVYIRRWLIKDSRNLVKRLAGDCALMLRGFSKGFARRHRPDVFVIDGVVLANASDDFRNKLREYCCRRSTLLVVLGSAYLTKSGVSVGSQFNTFEWAVLIEPSEVFNKYQGLLDKQSPVVEQFLVAKVKRARLLLGVSIMFSLIPLAYNWMTNAQSKLVWGRIVMEPDGKDKKKGVLYLQASTPSAVSLEIQNAMDFEGMPQMLSISPNMTTRIELNLRESRNNTHLNLKFADGSEKPIEIPRDEPVENLPD